LGATSLPLELDVRPGIELLLSDVPAAIRGKRVALIINHTGIDRSRVSDIDLIARHPDLKLAALLAPEHGIRQEVGGRTWTYGSTMALALEVAAKKKIPFVVLDRPNPIGGEIVEGALLDPAFKSFVGMYPIPARHGMTVGELATLFKKNME
jgi:uncharacterized protein YbbC (DUF1343 family)